MDFLELAEKRYSVRKFSDRPVDEESLEKILRAGQLAPTACNRQPIHTLVIRSSAALEKLQKCKRSHFGETLALLVCADTRECWTREYDGKKSGEIDASIVATHMMMEAWQLGIGSTWIMHFIPEAVREEFSLEDTMEPVCLLVMGYPAKDAEPSKMHFEKKELSEMTEIL